VIDQFTRAFSSEVGTGSREENASKQKTRAPFRFNRNGTGSSCCLQGRRTIAIHLSSSSKGPSLNFILGALRTVLACGPNVRNRHL
jgi:hypothetical protein